MCVTLNSVSSIRRQAGAEYLLLDSGAQLQGTPVQFVHAVTRQTRAYWNTAVSFLTRIVKKHFAFCMAGGTILPRHRVALS